MLFLPCPVQVNNWHECSAVGLHLITGLYPVFCSQEDDNDGAVFSSDDADDDDDGDDNQFGLGSWTPSPGPVSTPAYPLHTQ